MKHGNIETVWNSFTTPVNYEVFITVSYNQENMVCGNIVTKYTFIQGKSFKYK